MWRLEGLLGVGGGGSSSPPIYLSRLWADFQNSFVWWKLVKIVIDFYSISDFLLFIVWPLDVAEVAKVSRVNIFKGKIKFRNFWAKSMLYTSKERIFHVEFKFKQKRYGSIHYWKNWKKLNFSVFGSKTRLTRCLWWLISRFFYNKPQKWLCQELLKGLNLKVTKYELIISNQSEMADDHLQEPPHVY